MAGLHPSTAAILRHFAWQHLSPKLQAISRPVCDLANEMADVLPDGDQLRAGLWRLLEAKDCLVRAAIERGDL